MDMGLIIELWNKGMLWDKLIGTHWLPLITIKHSNQVSKGEGVGGKVSWSIHIDDISFGLMCTIYLFY